MLYLIVESDKGEIIFNQAIQSGYVITIFLIVAAFYLTFYVLRSIGIYTLAKRQGVENAYLAFIPCVWIYTVCKIIGKSRFFGFTVEKAAVWLCVIFSFATVVPLVYDFLVYFPYVMYYLQGGEVSLISRNGLYIETGVDFNNLFDTPAVNVLGRILYVFRYILSIAEIVITVSLYIALFKKFWPEHYILAAVLSFFGLFPVFVFAIRNRKAVDFNEYIRNRYYGAGYTPYGNRYYGNSGQNNDERGTPYYGNSSNGEKEPFGEFDNRPEEPFSEFDDNKKNDDK